MVYKNWSNFLKWVSIYDDNRYVHYTVAVRKAHKGYKLGPLMTLHSCGTKYTTNLTIYSCSCSRTLDCKDAHDTPPSHH